MSTDDTTATAPRPKGKAGRPKGKKTYNLRKVADELVPYLLRGVPISHALMIVGVRHQTHLGWMIQTDDPKCVEYARRIDEARAQGAEVYLDRIRTASQTQWPAAAWILRHSLPDAYGDKSAQAATATVSTAPDGSTQTTITVSPATTMSDADLLALATGSTTEQT